MANLPEQSSWTPGIYQLEETDLLEAGPGGIDNLQSTQLADRTLYLKDAVEAVVASKLDKTGTAEKAKSLESARNINLVGDATGTAGFDGSTDAEIQVSLKPSGVAAGKYGEAGKFPAVTLNDKGVVTAVELVDVTAGPGGDFIPMSQKGDFDGVAELNSQGTVPNDQLPTLFGLNQVLIDVTVQRSITTNVATPSEYTNTTGRPIVIYVSATSTVSDARLVAYMDGQPSQAVHAPLADQAMGLSLTIPNGSSYFVFANDIEPTIVWKEYI